MKKYILSLLVITMLIPVAACAVVGSSPFFGKWVGEEHHSVKYYDTVLHFVWIHENSPCVYMKFNLNHGGPITRPSSETETMYDSNWEIVDDHVRIPTSGISYLDLYYDGNTDTLYCENPKMTFVRVP